MTRKPTDRQMKEDLSSSTSSSNFIKYNVNDIEKVGIDPEKNAVAVMLKPGSTFKLPDDNNHLYPIPDDASPEDRTVYTYLSAENIDLLIQEMEGIDRSDVYSLAHFLRLVDDLEQRKNRKKKKKGEA